MQMSSHNVLLRPTILRCPRARPYISHFRPNGERLDLQLEPRRPGKLRMLRLELRDGSD